MPDFTIRTYEDLLKSLINQGFLFQAFTDFNGQPGKRAIFLRHDIDLLPENSLKIAKIQADKGISGTYYFRTVPESWNEKIIREIAEMGHEVGYHYEDMGATAQTTFAKATVVEWRHGAMAEEELVKLAIESFKTNLEKLRKIVPVKTICMHGSPMSRWDSRLLWKYYDYREFGIIGEPYFDINFDKVLYLTDTGRRWDGGSVSVRDTASGIGCQASGENPYKDWRVKPLKYRQMTQYTGPRNQDLAPRILHPAPFPRFHSTSDIIRAAEKGKLPDRIMMTFHPQRWTDKPLPWVKELVWQNVKNVAKYFIVRQKALGNR